MAINSMKQNSVSTEESSALASAELCRLVGPKTVASWDSDVVAEFANGDDDILVVARRPVARVHDVVDAGRMHEYWAMVGRDNVARELRFGMKELRLRSNELAADIADLVTSFLDQFDIEHAKIRLEITRTQSCPNFHCDNEHVRLVTTYTGPTTEYQHAGENTILTAPLYGLVFLKGRRHPTHSNSVYHRSPNVPDGEKRLFLAIDY